MGYSNMRKRVRAYRGQIVSPGRPTVAWREDRVRFWAAIGEGKKTRGFRCRCGRVRASRSSLVPECWRRESLATPAQGILGVISRLASVRT